MKANDLKEGISAPQNRGYYPRRKGASQENLLTIPANRTKNEIVFGATVRRIVLTRHSVGKSDETYQKE